MNLKHIIRDAGYLCLGTAALVAEKGGEAARHLVRRGSEVWENNQDTVNAVSRKAKDLYEKAKEKLQTPPVTQFEVEELTDEERAALEELRRQRAEEAAAEVFDSGEASANEEDSDPHPDANI